MKQVINVGVSANDGSGDTLRNSQQKANSNFTELYNRGLQEVTDVNNETTNPIKFDLDSLSMPDEIGSYQGVSFYFKPFISGFKQHLANSNVTADRIAEFPNFDVNLNGCTIADNYTNDTTAAAGGIAIGQMYHTAGVVKIRLT